jgi:hypothetical protein
MTKKDKIRRAVMVAGVAATMAGGALGLAPAEARSEASQPSSPNDRPGSLTPAQRRVVREATARYRDADAAVAAGYVPTDECEADPAQGGMGYHYAHSDLVADGAIDPTRPEVLVYAPGPDGDLRLGAIEYLNADADGDVGTDDDRPTLFGEPFDGPMEGHVPGQPVHYDLHVWAWWPNPAGELAQFNPTVTCPPAPPSDS